MRARTLASMMSELGERLAHKANTIGWNWVETNAGENSSIVPPAIGFLGRRLYQGKRDKTTANTASVFLISVVAQGEKIGEQQVAGITVQQLLATSVT